MRRQIKHTAGGFTTTIVFTNIESYGKCGHEGEVREKEEKCVMEKGQPEMVAVCLFTSKNWSPNRQKEAAAAASAAADLLIVKRLHLF